MPAEPEPKPECPICIEPYKGKKVQQVTCQYCPSHACRGCQQRYLLQSYEDPHCMECKRGWSTEFMAANFPLVFRNDALRKHRRKVSLEREKALLPAMQVYVEYKRDAERARAEMRRIDELLGTGQAPASVAVAKAAADPSSIRNRYISLATRRDRILSSLAHERQLITQLKKDYEAALAAPGGTTAQATKELLDDLTTARNRRTGLKEQLKQITPEYEEKKILFKELTTAFGNAQREAWRAQAQYEDRFVAGAAGGGRAPEKREFVMRCPDDGCRGFLSTAYKCGVCTKYTCTQCHVVLGESKPDDHVCNKDDVESAKAIKAETRPCPKCGTRIFKIDGCDQMWCIMDGCHTAFSWNTGHIVTGVVHNPHYYEWLRRTGGGQAPREAGDIPCGDLPRPWVLQEALGAALFERLPRGTVAFDALNRIMEIASAPLRAD